MLHYEWINVWAVSPPCVTTVAACITCMLKTFFSIYKKLTDPLYNYSTCTSESKNVKPLGLFQHNYVRAQIQQAIINYKIEVSRGLSRRLSCSRGKLATHWNNSDHNHEWSPCAAILVAIVAQMSPLLVVSLSQSRGVVTNCILIVPFVLNTSGASSWNWQLFNRTHSEFFACKRPLSIIQHKKVLIKSTYSRSSNTQKRCTN